MVALPPLARTCTPCNLHAQTGRSPAWRNVHRRRETGRLLNRSAWQHRTQQSKFQFARLVQRSDVEKCKTWKTRGFTLFPDVRHTLGIRQCCSQCASDTAAVRPLNDRPKPGALPGLDIAKCRGLLVSAPAGIACLADKSSTKDSFAPPRAV